MYLQDYPLAIQAFTLQPSPLLYRSSEAEGVFLHENRPLLSSERDGLISQQTSL